MEQELQQDGKGPDGCDGVGGMGGHGDALEIRTTISVDGPLAFVWRKLVAESVAKGMEVQTERLIERARHV